MARLTCFLAWLISNIYCRKTGVFGLGLVPQGGGTLIFSHIHRLELFWGVQNSEFQIFWGFSEKWIFLGGMKILWIFFGVITKLG